MSPPYEQLNVELGKSTASPPEVTSSEAPSHGLAVIGTQGAGVGVPNARAVAAITKGFVFALHITNVAKLAIGAKSFTVAMAFELAVLTLEVTTNEQLPAPSLHEQEAPLTTLLDPIILLHLV
jgi:hypothetical protein